MNRKEIAHKEATRDPIFLFQERVVTLRAEYDTSVEWDEELEVYITTGRDKKHLDDNGLVAHGYADITWRTTDVFLTREEGETFGKATAYRYTDKRKGIGWQVYCIALERDSELAKLLQKVDKMRSLFEK
jgi:hypothetical protein